MATHSNILAWEIPWTEESGGLQPMRSQRVEKRDEIEWREDRAQGRRFLSNFCKYQYSQFIIAIWLGYARVQSQILQCDCIPLDFYDGCFISCILLTLASYDIVHQLSKHQKAHEVGWM